MKAHAKTIALGAAMLTSLGSGGYYQFVGGTSDQAVGVVGTYQVGGPKVQTLQYADPAALEIGIRQAVRVTPDLRRLTFVCGDGSQRFTVYINPITITGIPDHSVVCDDGYPLLVYTRRGN